MITFGPNTLGIGIVISLRNQFSQQAQAVTNSMNALHGNAMKVYKANLQAARGLGVGLTATGLLATRGMYRALETAAKFEFTMKSIQGVLAASNQEIADLSQLALKLGTETIYTADEVAGAMESMARQGVPLDKLRKSIQAVIDLGAAAGGKPLAGKGGVADYLMSIMHEFNLRAEQSAMAADIIAKTANVSSSDVEDIAQALKYASGTAHILNIGLGETAAMLGTLSNAGLKGGVAGRALNNMLIYLANAVGKFRTKRQADAFSTIGLTIQDIVNSKGELRPILDIMNTFGQKLKGMAPTEQISALTALFNMRGARAMIPILEKSINMGYNFADTLRMINEESGDYAKTISGMLMNTVHGDLEILKDTWKTFNIEVGTTLGIIARPLASAITYILNGLISIAKTPFGKAMIILAAALAVAATAAGALLTIFVSIKLLTWAGTVSAANMGRTLSWAWNSAAAAALRYATVAKGAMLVNTPTGARWRSLTTGRFVAAPAAGAAASGGSLSFLRTLISANGALGVFGRIMTGLTGVVAGVISVLGVVIGFKNMLMMIGYALGTFFQAIAWIFDFIFNLGEGPIDAFNIANKRFSERNKHLREVTGQSMTEAPMSFKNRGTVGTQANNAPDIVEEYRRMQARRRDKNIQVQINLDGKQIGKAAMKEPEEDWIQKLNYKMN